MTSIYGNANSFAVEMKKAINDTEFSDITFIVGETREKIHAHRMILSARCEVFRAMFAEQKSQASKRDGGKRNDHVPLVLPDVRPSVFLAVIEYIYSNSCTLNSSTVVDVLASAIEYGLDGLASCCSNYIVDNLTVDTACSAMQAAIAYNQSELKATCLEFIEKNTEAVFKSKHFVEISSATFAYILQSDKLQIAEKQVLAAVQEWAGVNSVVTGQSLAETMKDVVVHVRFPLLDSATLQEVESKNEKDNTIPVKLIAKAWKYQATKTPVANDPHFTPRAAA
eukprot:TRINITY_DN8065_c0_g1_i1.p1 TRINITY_DN8065_c0_g1~~TRINITY_DN8065_c0_g1_i1.p1  ORF type:complete len:282 (+),score=72.93 TRINITY_DN8065_c0_g1_i1:86-931(+)